MKSNLVLGAMLLSALSAAGQIDPWVLPGNLGTTWTSDYLGTQDAERLTLRTLEDFRFVINEDDAYTIGAFTSTPALGFIGISPNYNFWDDGPGPFSRLHLAEGSGDNTQSIGYRPWMRNGISFTGNADQMYIGQKYTYDDPTDPGSSELNDYTDAIIQWSDNPGTWLSDRMRFIFTSEYNGAVATGNSSLEGLEAMQLFPREGGTEVFVGIGDWFGQSASPEERLDVLDGHVRIRQLPNDDEMKVEKMVVVDDTGVLGWQTIPTGGGSDCDWTVIPGTGAGTNDVYTAVGTSVDECPDASDHVGIGIANPTYKLDVKEDVSNTSGNDIAVNAVVIGDGGANDNIGVNAEASSTSAGSERNIGMQGIATNGADCYGYWGIGKNTTGTSSNVYGGRVQGENLGGTVANLYGLRSETYGESTANSYGVYTETSFGLANSFGLWSRGKGDGASNMGVYAIGGGTANNSINFGVQGTATGVGSPAPTGLVNYGVYGEAFGGGTGSTNYGVYGKEYGTVNNTTTQDPEWAGYFSGDVQITGSLWHSTTNIFSDADLKINEQDLMNASELLAQLQPKTYEFDLATYGFMGLPDGSHLGLLAQDVATVLPDLVSTETFPAAYDSLGNMMSPAVPDVQGLNYMELIPLLIAGWKEQQAQIAQLQSDLAGCCSNGSMQLQGGSNGQGTSTGSIDALDRATEQLRIQPNPFGDGTTITYTLASPGQVRLIVSTSAGKQLSVLEEGTREAGTYTYEWNTVSMASGVYNVMLLVDGAPMVQKAIKIAR